MTKNIVIKSNENIVLPILWLGNEPRLSYNIILAGNGAKITLPVILLGKKKDKLNLTIKIYHQKPNTKSDIIIKSALKDNAEIEFDGLIKIEPGAINAEAKLTSNTLLLSDKAKIRVMPSLEIFEKNIKAGHSATIAKIDNTQLFYLMSRGLSENTAKSLIIQGFLSNFLNNFPRDFAEKARKRIKNFNSEK